MLRPAPLLIAFLLAMLVIPALLVCAPAFANCANPAKSAGDIIYNADRNVMQYCDGTTWRAMGASGISDNLVGWWKLDEGTGTATADSSGNGNNGTLTGSPLPTWTTGEINDAVQFNASAPQYVDVGNAASLNFERTQPFSIAAWIYPASGAGSFEYIFEKENNAASPFQGYAMFMDTGNNSLGLYLYGSTGSDSLQAYSPGSAITLNTWQHVVATYDGSSLASGVRLYVNGVLQTPLTVPNNNLSSSILDSVDAKIGTDGPAYQYFYGKIDDVRVYNRALSASDVAAVYVADIGSHTCGPTTSGLVGWWKLDEKTATDATDSSGKGNALTSVSAYGETPGAVVVDKYGYARNLDNGGNDGFQLGAGGVEAASVPASLQGMTQFTASIWVKTTSLNSTDQSFFIGMDNYPNYGFELFDNGPYAAFVDFAIYDGGDHYLTIPRASVNDGNWHLLTGTYDGTAQKFYLDGILQGSQAAGYVDGPFVPDDGPWIGAGISSGSMILHDGRIYNRALSPLEVMALYIDGGVSYGPEGDIKYNTDHHVMQYCNGATWVPMGPSRVGNGPTSGLVGWWKFDEGSGTTTADSSGNSNNGAFAGGANPTWTSGELSGGLHFAGGGSGDYVGVPNAANLSGMSALTVSAWINASPGASGSVWVKRSTTGSPVWSSYYLDADTTTNNRYQLQLCNNSATCSGFVATANGSLVTNTWQNIVMVYDGTTAQMYVNGVASGTADTTVTGAIATTDGEFAIGNNVYETGFIGSMDDVRVYNRALSATEISELYSGVTIGGSGGSCTLPSRSEGDLLYNTDHNVMQYCNGATWVGIGK